MLQNKFILGKELFKIKFWIVLIPYFLLSSCAYRYTLYSKEFSEIAYSNRHHQAIYVKYKAVHSALNNAVKRTNNFKIDYAVDSTITLKSYKGSGYDRGHLKPAAVSKGSVSEMKESFLLSNVAPQYPYFNRVTWRGIEADVRALLQNQDSLIVYTGVIYRKRAKRLNKKVEVPYYFYKTILLGDSTATIAFLAKNDSTSVKGLDYKISVNKLERHKNLPSTHV